MADDDDVPPLEDMSEMLEQVKAISHSTKKTECPKVASKATPIPQTQPIVSTEPPVKDPALKEKERQSTAAKQANKASVQGTGFGGMKKGFLFGGSTTAKSKTPKSAGSKSQSSVPKSSDDIPLIKPKQSQQDERRIPEVQEAMMSDFLEKNKGAWMTEDLMKKIQNNDTLMKRLADPRFMSALTEFQTNPKAAAEKYKDNPEMDKFLREFSGIMGDHLMKLGDQTAPAPVPQAPAIQSEDERRMQQILADPEVRDIFQDPRVQQLFQALRTDPDNAQRFIREADPVLQGRLRKLVDVGLLQIQR